MQPTEPLHLKRDNHFLHRVSARKMELYAQELSFSQETICFQEHNGTAHKVLLRSSKINFTISFSLINKECVKLNL